MGKAGRRCTARDRVDAGTHLLLANKITNCLTSSTMGMSDSSSAQRISSR